MRRVALVAAMWAAAAPCAHVLAQEAVTVLAKLERGRWVVRPLDKSVPERSICLRDSRQFIQLEHGGAGCGQELVSSGANSSTVQYSCPGRGYGHTTVRLETPRAATIDTQGLIDGRPFSYRAVARKTGAC